MSCSGHFQQKISEKEQDVLELAMELQKYGFLTQVYRDQNGNIVLEVCKIGKSKM